MRATESGPGSERVGKWVLAQGPQRGAQPEESRTPAWEPPGRVPVRRVALTPTELGSNPAAAPGAAARVLGIHV